MSKRSNDNVARCGVDALKDHAMPQRCLVGGKSIYVGPWPGRPLDHVATGAM